MPVPFFFAALTSSLKFYILCLYKWKRMSAPTLKKKKKRYTANNPFPLCILLIYLASIVFLAVQYFCLKKNILHKDKMLSIGQWVTKDSVQFSQSVVSNSLRPHGLQHARPPCPSPAPGVYPNSSPLSQWCHPTISFSVIPFSSHLQSFPASGSLTMSQLFTSGSQSIGVSASTSVLLMNTQDWFPLGWTYRISLQSKGLSRVFSTPQFKSINSSALSFL